MLTILTVVLALAAGWAFAEWRDQRRQEREDEAARKRIERWREEGLPRRPGGES
jgi:hypothetical protein